MNKIVDTLEKVNKLNEKVLEDIERKKEAYLEIHNTEIPSFIDDALKSIVEYQTALSEIVLNELNDMDNLSMPRSNKKLTDMWNGDLKATVNRKMEFFNKSLYTTREDMTPFEMENAYRHNCIGYEDEYRNLVRQIKDFLPYIDILLKRFSGE